MFKSAAPSINCLDHCNQVQWWWGGGLRRRKQRRRWW